MCVCTFNCLPLPLPLLHTQNYRQLFHTNTTHIAMHCFCFCLCQRRRRQRRVYCPANRRRFQTGLCFALCLWLCSALLCGLSVCLLAIFVLLLLLLILLLAVLIFLLHYFHLIFVYFLFSITQYSPPTHTHIRPHTAERQTQINVISVRRGRDVSLYFVCLLHCFSKQMPPICRTCCCHRLAENGKSFCLLYFVISPLLAEATQRRNRTALE